MGVLVAGAVFGTAMFLLCLYAEFAPDPARGELCRWAGEGEAKLYPRSGLQVRIWVDGDRLTAMCSRGVPPEGFPSVLGKGYFEIGTDPHRVPVLGHFLKPQIWELSKDGQVVIPYEFSAAKARGERRVLGPLFLLFFGALAAVCAVALVTGQ